MRAAVAILLCALAGAAPAHAAYDPLGSGTTELTLAKPFARFLASHGVTLEAAQGATRKGRTYVLPVAGGSLDPTLGKGEIENAGALVFKRGPRRVPLRDVVVRTRREPLTAKVGGSQLKLAGGAKLSQTRSGFGSAIAAKPLRLTAKLATRLGKKLRLHREFEEGQLFGTLRVDAQPASVAILPIGRATFVPDPAFLAKLDGLFVSLNPIAPTERGPGPIFTFPIIGGGALAPNAASGTLRSGGALELLQLGAGKVIWNEPWFDFGVGGALVEARIEPSPPYPGNLGQLPLLSLAAGLTGADAGARTITVSGAPLALNGTSAAHLNLAFAGGKDLFNAGEAVGTVSFIAQAQ